MIWEDSEEERPLSIKKEKKKKKFGGSLWNLGR